MRRLVESVGRAWAASPGGPWSAEGGREHGSAQVGGRWVDWTRAGPGEIRVTHADGTSPLAVLFGSNPGVEAYAVRLATSATHAGGVRLWWSCLGCGRRCGRLYLPPGRPRLGCRVCYRLAYACRYRPKSERRRRKS